MLRCAYLTGLALVLLGGCSSTLNEYQCVSSLDCDGETEGRCEASGHCSFADDACTSGFRFGEGSGSESGSCVGDEPGLPDAAPAIDAVTPDAMDPTPIANIGDSSLGCEGTNDNFDGSGSQAFDGRTLTLFEWTLRGPGGQVLDKFSGAPDDPVYRQMYRRGGTFRDPNINVATYHDDKGIFVDVTIPTASDGEALQEVLDSSGNVTLTPPLRLTFAIGTETSPVGATVQLLDSVGGIVLDETVAVDTTLAGHTFDLPASATPVSQPMTLKFSFDTATRYWIDNVSVVDMSNGDNISNNGSVENFLGTSPWDVVTSTTNVGASRADIPVALRQNGTYTVELQVTDSTDEKSLPVSVEVTLEDCD